jgi:prepilin-type N-terminal cleavage/methylation domain-containing protein
MNFRRTAKSVRYSAYTLIEVLVAASLIGVAMTAAVSMSTTMMLQEELSWRVAVAMNYQENACRVWQLGLTPAEVTAVMPGTAGHPFLNEILETTASTTTLATANQGGLGVMEGATNSLQVANYANGPAGSTTTVQLYRQTTRSNATEP